MSAVWGLVECAPTPVFFRPAWEMYAVAEIACEHKGCGARVDEWCLDSFGSILEGVHEIRLLRSGAFDV